jgi:hydroxyacylglutathione hydrolase
VKVNPKIEMTADRLLVRIVRCLQDNYAYIVYNKHTKAAVLIDAVQPDRIIPVIKEHQLQVNAILTTHHHHDHSGGNPRWRQLLPNVPIYGGDTRVNGITDLLADNQILQLSLDGPNQPSTSVKCLHTPGHTRSHICYYWPSIGSVFTGDTLFLGGCGRLFEGTAKEMFSSLNERLGGLPDETLVYCGHEYTANNLRFALTIEPDNHRLIDAFSVAQQQSCTVPGSIAVEKQTNPFMRADLPQLQKQFGTIGDPVRTLQHLRSLKDQF